MRRLFAFAAVALALVACDEPAAKIVKRSSATAQRAANKLDARDQYALAKDIVSAQRADLDEDPDAYGRVVRGWQGKRYQWELRVVTPLCRRADSCVLAPFDHNVPEKPIVQGWLPRVELNDASFAELQNSCKDKKQCVVRIEATMKELDAGETTATRVTFDNVRVVDARSAKEAESWVVSKRHRRPS